MMCDRRAYPHTTRKPLKRIGGRTRTRTWDPLIKSQLLYQLSYAPGMPARAGREGCVL
jgi:hypothetical protein